MIPACLTSKLQQGVTRSATARQFSDDKIVNYFGWGFVAGLMDYFIRLPYVTTTTMATTTEEMMETTMMETTMMPTTMMPTTVASAKKVRKQKKQKKTKKTKSKNLKKTPENQNKLRADEA